MSEMKGWTFWTASLFILLPCRAFVNMFLYDPKVHFSLSLDPSVNLIINLRLLWKLCCSFFSIVALPYVQGEKNRQVFITKLQSFKIHNTWIITKKTKQKKQLGRSRWKKDSEYYSKHQKSVVCCCPNIVTNGVIVQCEHFILVSVELDHRSALVLVPLKNTANLNQVGI